MNPAQVKAAGQSAESLGAQLPQGKIELNQATDQASAGLRGTATLAALDACTTSWNAVIDRLAADMDNQGRNLVTSADNVSTANGSVADSFRTINAQP
ncbi:hypothetical protein OG455_15350 [Kitasatospora sp. NBC_01287]|uniref:hypothetical protein n=1 Tax=Kitasatospora sp. NBC_01287 TaxID=2903573 RepID=UPI0022592C62|nr:hypothetical protein [Kitasatospora sp. NBC_01287]MCX4746881.1 hypothetical protein [Kitasatospora sp. NBC_01287]